MNNIKESVKKMIAKIYGASNKKIMALGVISLLMPFVLSYLCLGLINFSAWIAELAILKIGPQAFIVSWPIDRILAAMLSPIADFTMIAFFPLAAILGIMVLIKTKGQNLSALFVASMGLVFFYGFVFIQ